MSTFFSQLATFFGSVINVGVKPTDIAKKNKKAKKEEHI
jgi:hypothetical protein